MSTKPTNILLILTDQLSAQALRAWGNSYGATPAIDSLIEGGVRFSQAYTNCPLCQPARASFWSGRLPHRTGVLSNGRLDPVPQLDESVPTLGSQFAEAGYTTVHFGKQHDAGALRGFTSHAIERKDIPDADPAWPVNYDTEQDRNTREQAVNFLDTYSGTAPFIAVASLNNPHDICNWVGAFQDRTPPIIPDGELPPLPANLYPDEAEFAKLPRPVQYICCAHNRQAQIAEWDELKIRLYLRAYHHYIERVDNEIALILKALRRRPDAGETLVVFMADHGDSMGGRWMATKHTSFYDETTRIPLVFAGPGVSGRDRIVDGPVSLLDLFPTLCDAAGLPIPDGLDGRSLLPWITGSAATAPHACVTSQWHTEWGFTVEPGRMIRTARYKYTHYLEENGEQLYDLSVDPGELHNLVDHPDHQSILAEHRRLLRDTVNRTGDPYFTLTWKAAPRWRSHPPGYRNHRGPAAPTADG